jgi:hypothetical protein
MTGRRSQGRLKRGNSLRAAFRAAAREVTAPRPGQVSRAKGGGDSASPTPLLTTGAIADSFIKLCQNPLVDLQRWFQEQPNKVADDSAPSTGRMSDQVQSAPLATAGFRDHALHELQGRVDAHGGDGKNSDRLSSESRTGSFGDDGLRPVRVEGEGSAGPTVEEFGGLDGLASELAAINGEFRTRLAAARSQGVPIEVVRAIRLERMLAVRAARERWQQKISGVAQRRSLVNSQQNQFRPILSLRRTLE